MLKIFKATKTLENFNKNLKYTSNKSESELLIVGGKEINLEEFPNLKGIFKTGVGVDNIPFEEAKKRDVLIELPSKETCEIIYNETSSFASHFILNHVYKDKGDFDAWQKNIRKAFERYNVLVVGAGNIGSRVVKKLSLFCNVSVFDITLNNYHSLDKMLSDADIVSIHLPLSTSTRNLFNSKKLSILKDGALIVNTSRAHIINEKHLFNELENKRIFAAIDVFWDEPYDGILNNIKTEHLIKTPHIASTCSDFLIGLSNDFLNFHNKILQSEF